MEQGSAQQPRHAPPGAATPRQHHLAISHSLRTVHSRALPAEPAEPRCLWQVNAMMRVATTWVGKLSPKLRDACWLTGEKSSRSRKRSGHAPPPWQPLFFVSGDNMEAFELELRWTSTTLAATLGTMKVVLPAGETLCATTLEILQVSVAAPRTAVPLSCLRALTGRALVSRCASGDGRHAAGCHRGD